MKKFQLGVNCLELIKLFELGSLFVSKVLFSCCPLFRVTGDLMATMLSRRISLLNCELSQQCHITMHVEKDRHRMQPNSASPSSMEESGSTHELPGVC